MVTAPMFYAQSGSHCLRHCCYENGDAAALPQARIAAHVN